MPWCEECSKYWTPNSTNDDGTCPKCGEQLDGGLHGQAVVDGGVADDEKAPWHFKLMVAMVVLYLGWRLVQIVV